MEDVLKKFGAEPYTPGQKIPVMLSVETLMALDSILNEKSNRKKDKPA